MIENKLNNSERGNTILFVILCIGIFIRIFMAYWHFTHVDDIAVLLTYIFEKQSTNELLQGFKMAQTFTYAPIQGVFNSLLVNKIFPYRLNIFMSRIPSCIFGILSIFLTIKISSYLDMEKNKYLKIFICALICFSWENIIYSAQAEPYSIIVFFGFILILSAFQKFYENWKLTFLYLCIFTIGCYSHYQFFILIFCYYVALYACNLKNKDNFIRIFVVSIGNFLLALPLLYFFVLESKIDRGINWNAGICGQFALSFPNSDISTSIFYFIKFFIRNIFYIFKYFFTIDSFDFVSTLFAFFLLLIAATGLFYMHKKNRILAIFSDILILVIMVMVTKQKLTFGPSRHSLYIYPMLLLLISYGLVFLSEAFINNEKLHIFQNFSINAALGILCISFVFSLPRELGNRKNLWSEKEINKIADEYSVDFIFGTAWSPDIAAMHFDGYKYTYWGQYVVALDKYNKTGSINHRFFIVSRWMPLKEMFAKPIIDQYHKEAFNSFFSEHDIDDFNILYEKEINLETEVEYASRYYSNCPNGLYLYVIEPNLSTNYIDD